jgi:putative hemolysin
MSSEMGIKDSKGDFIDLEKVIAGKNPALLKVLPRFVISYLKRVIHQDEVNTLIRENRHLYGLEFLDVILRSFGARIHASGTEHLSPTGRWIVASNHPLGGLDGMALMGVAGKIRRDIVFPVNDILMNLENLKELFIPINKHGTNTGNVRTISDTYSSDKAILYFPAGLCSRKGKNGICDLEWKKSFITKTRASQRDIIPTYIEGRNSNWFYNLARVRTKLGIKANIEMLYLVDEMFRQNNQDIFITFGSPIPYSIFDRRYTDLDWAQKLKQHVYSLRNDPLARFPY